MKGPASYFKTGLATQKPTQRPCPETTSPRLPATQGIKTLSWVWPWWRKDLSPKVWQDGINSYLSSASIHINGIHCLLAYITFLWNKLTFYLQPMFLCESMQTRYPLPYIHPFSKSGYLREPCNLRSVCVFWGNHLKTPKVLLVHESPTGWTRVVWSAWPTSLSPIMGLIPLTQNTHQRKPTH